MIFLIIIIDIDTFRMKNEMKRNERRFKSNNLESVLYKTRKKGINLHIGGKQNGDVTLNFNQKRPMNLI